MRNRRGCNRLKPWIFTAEFKNDFASGGSRRWNQEAMVLLLYVVMALTGALLTFVGLDAQQNLPTMRTSAHSATAIALLGARVSGRPGEDLRQGQRPGFLRPCAVRVSRLGGISRRGAARMVCEYRQWEPTAGKDLKVSRHGTVAWTAVSMHFSEKTKDGKSNEAEVRCTGIWEKRGRSWLLVHEHPLAPSGG